MDDRKWMDEALELARAAGAAGDVPVGCVIVRGDEIVGQGQNRREETHDATAHAEMEAIRMASQALGRWHLEDCTLYVTLEPCPMCAGAVWNARMGRVVFGAADPRAGCCGSLLHFGLEGLTPEPEIVGGVEEAACAALLRDFFQDLRYPKKVDG
ncbi:MAG: nucleoside deaminase [Clostridiales bacterium]|nr:nucleoside deaminase [Clostridiales bacterium]